MDSSVSITQLPISQLQLIKQEIEQATLVQFNQGQESIKTLQNTTAIDSSNNSTCLIPLTNSLYVTGVLNTKDKVTVDVGTGYYVEMCLADALSFYARKSGYLKESLDKLEVSINQKQDQRGAVVEVVQQKYQMIQRESLAAKEKK